DLPYSRSLRDALPIYTDALPAIRMTRQDAGRLDALLADYPTDSPTSGAGLLLRELLRAEVVPSEKIAHTTVVMHSAVTFRDDSRSEEHTSELQSREKL